MGIRDNLIIREEKIKIWRKNRIEISFSWNLSLNVEPANNQICCMHKIPKPTSDKTIKHQAKSSNLQKEKHLGVTAE